jgi:glycosyltransferase involved in cell wall biosynthesis
MMIPKRKSTIRAMHNCVYAKKLVAQYVQLILLKMHISRDIIMLQNHSAYTMTRICLGVCTRQRPILLSQCLDSIQDLDIPDQSGLMIVIVDNDDTASARGLVEGFQRENPNLAVFYLHEPRRGIALARNAILRFAQQHLSDWIVMLDDDQRVPSSWLLDLFAAQFKTGAEVVKSSVTYHYPDPLPRWAFPKGRPHKWQLNAEMAATNGVLFSGALIDPHDFGLRFREAYNLSCGEDRDFFKSASMAGALIVHTPDAVAYEMMPPSKLTFTTQVRRQFHEEWVNTQQDMRFHGASRTILRKSCKAAQMILHGAILTLLSPLSALFSPRRGRKQLLKGAKRFAKAFGLITGLVSSARPAPYQNVHGY